MLVENTVKFVRVTDYEYDCIFNDKIFGKILFQINGEYYYKFLGDGLVSGWVLEKIALHIKELNGKYWGK
jgi:hypothetical protein